jgi:hypothetical protein
VCCPSPLLIKPFCSLVLSMLRWQVSMKCNVHLQQATDLITISSAVRSWLLFTRKNRTVCREIAWMNFLA